jgi:hypothetical protein
MTDIERQQSTIQYLELTPTTSKFIGLGRCCMMTPRQSSRGVDYLCTSLCAEWTTLLSTLSHDFEFLGWKSINVYYKPYRDKGLTSVPLLPPSSPCPCSALLLTCRRIYSVFAIRVRHRATLRSTASCSRRKWRRGLHTLQEHLLQESHANERLTFVIFRVRCSGL